MANVIFDEPDNERHANRSESLAQFLSKAYELRERERQGGKPTSSEVWLLIDDLGRQISRERHAVSNIEHAITIFFYGDKEYGFPSKLKALQDTIEEGVHKIVAASGEEMQAMKAQMRWIRTGLAVIGSIVTGALIVWLGGILLHFSIPGTGVNG